MKSFPSLASVETTRSVILDAMLAIATLELWFWCRNFHSSSSRMVLHCERERVEREISMATTRQLQPQRRMVMHLEMRSK
jgi:hypothetical protein